MKTLETSQDVMNFVQEPGLKCVVYSTAWCGDCLYLKPSLPAIEKEFGQFEFASADRDACMDAAQAMNVMGIPSFVCFKDGREVGRFVSTLRKTPAQVKSFLEDVLKRGETQC